MQFHVERKLRVKSDPKSSYPWAINELDPKGKTGPDMIPWPWTQYFTATSAVVSDEVRIAQELADEENPSHGHGCTHGQVIRVQLVSGDGRRPSERKVVYSMFGTDREIKTFQLDIRPVPDADTKPYCRSWGAVSYTAEGADFLDETHDDCLVFTLCTGPAEYAHLSARVSAGEVNELVFSIGTARGFYAQWTMGTSTRAVKVLTRDKDEQDLELPAGSSIDPPRLGDVGTAELYVNRRLELVTATAGVDENDPPAGSKIPTNQLFSGRSKSVVSAEDRGLKLIGSLSNAAWLIVFLQALILAALLNR